jgi:hypothetical protein
MNQEPNQTEGRKPYAAPMLTTIDLRPEEAILSHCKTPSGGTMGSVCNNFLLPCVQNFGS